MVQCSNCDEVFEFPIYRKKRVTLSLSPPYTEKSIPGETYRSGKVEDIYIPCCPFCRTPVYILEDFIFMSEKSIEEDP